MPVKILMFRSLPRSSSLTQYYYINTVSAIASATGTLLGVGEAASDRSNSPWRRLRVPLLMSVSPSPPAASTGDDRDGQQ